MDTDISEEDFFLFLQKTISVFEFYSQSFITKKRFTLDGNIQEFIDFLKPFVNTQIINGITSPKDLQTIIWSENDYDEKFWSLMRRDIATVFLRLLMFEIIAESDMCLIQNSMRWLYFYSLALCRFYLKNFLNDKTKFFQDLKFFTCILKINLKLFSHDQIEGFFYYLYKLTGIYFENANDYIEEDFNSKNVIENYSQEFDFLEKDFREQIKNVIIPYDLNQLKKQKNDLSSYFRANSKIRPFNYFFEYKHSDLSYFLLNCIKDENEKNQILVKKDNDYFFEQMPWGLDELILSDTNKFFENSQLFISAKIFTDVFEGTLFLNEENMLDLDPEENKKFIEGYDNEYKFSLEFDNFKNNYLQNLIVFLENLKERGGLSIDFSHLRSSHGKYHETLNKLFAFSADCLFFKKAFIKNQDYIKVDIKRIKRIWKFFGLLIEIEKKQIFIPEIPFLKATKKTDIYQYFVFHVNYFSNVTNQAKISEITMEQYDLKNIIEEEEGSLQSMIETILKSKVIKDYYECLDNNDSTTNEYLIPIYIQENKFWDRVKYSKLFTFHSGMTITELIIILNDHLPGIFDVNFYDEEKISIVSYNF